ncbi:TetR/AcrR family transcriptional regulator [Antrihabitans spumae]|uniref:TetR/AcrR family transcriptional regulator n=1 Tax=Antrihabitans spumae TaxID=3373370 RepID=A0ABW7JKI9_9NOCA
MTRRYVKMLFMATVVRPFRGVSAQDRVAQRRADLIEAAFDVVGDGGLAKLTMTAVCERAGLTQRYFYEQFDNRDDLVNALFDEVFEQYFGRARVAAEGQPPDLHLRARAAMEVFVDFFATDPRKARVFAESVATESAAKHKAESVRRFAEYAADQAFSLLGALDDRGHTRVKIATSIIVGGLTDTAAQWLAGSIDLPRDEFIDEIALLFVVAIEAACRVR